MTHLGYLYYLGLLAAAGVAIRHYFLIRQRDKESCFQAFLHNNWFGLAVFVGLVGHYSFI
jgi:4-hydroxybenzoate polyprenyltransferase